MTVKGYWDLLAAGFLALALLGAGVFILTRMMRSEPEIVMNLWRQKLAPHSLQIVGLTFLIPAILMVAVATNLNSDAVTALLGSIIGYIFGAAKSAEPPPPPAPPPAPEAKSSSPG